ncbi:winged helix-turn-helix domain-containing protein [Tsuneonella sp. HG249]
MNPGIFSFGPFVLDPADRRLTRDGEPVEVSARYLDALILLVAEDGRLVTKDRFMAEVWRGIPVTDEALTQCIRSLRRALDDDAAAPRYIETVPRHGYRFAAPVEAAADTPTRTAVPTTIPVPLIGEAAAGALGGAMAGSIGALAYVSAGLVGPGIGAASTLLVLLSINVLLGALAGGAIGLAVSLGSSRAGSGSLWTVAAAAGAGLLVGALGHMVGNDLFDLLFGRRPGFITGGREGLLVGAATGAGLWIATRFTDRDLIWRAAPAPLLGALAGIALTLLGGRLMVGSLAEVTARFPTNRLGMTGGLSPGELLAATALESALFAGFTAWAIVAARRLRGSGAH